MSKILIVGRGFEAKHKCPKCRCPKMAMEEVSYLELTPGPNDNDFKNFFGF